MARTAELHRIVAPDFVCPYGRKSKELLERRGFKVEDHHLPSKAASKTFAARIVVASTPHTWIARRRIGGYQELAAHFGETPEKIEERAEG